MSLQQACLLARHLLVSCEHTFLKLFHRWQHKKFACPPDTGRGADGMQMSPIQQGLQDAHPYVRRTAVTGVLKVYHLDSAAVLNAGAPGPSIG